MNYYSLRSIISSGKSPLTLRSPIESFRVWDRPDRVYIEPNFAKEEFAIEHPSVILVSAIGATGKSTLAQNLSWSTGLPLLDLGRHQPVAAHSLTGLLTESFSASDLSTVFTRLAQGAYGIIIDGLDEARSRVSEEAFEAFLKDVAKLCIGSKDTSIVLLGRTSAVEDSWLHLTEMGVDTALVSISPFDLSAAEKYVDTFSGGAHSDHAREYLVARDHVLRWLSRTFSDGNENDPEGDFLKFIGYPPVLDAIVTLLVSERNYHGLLARLRRPDEGEVEIALILQIARYVLEREKEQKVKVNILDQLTIGLPESERDSIQNGAFEIEEQCIRLIAFCQGQALALRIINDARLNERYEEQLGVWLPEHPFLTGRRFRNVVFEAMALATLIGSPEYSSHPIVMAYIRSHRSSHHLILLLSAVLPDATVPLKYLGVLVGSAMEYRTKRTQVDVSVEKPEWTPPLAHSVNIDVEIYSGDEPEPTREFSFLSDLVPNVAVELTGGLQGVHIDLPCTVVISGNSNLELIAPVEIQADKIVLDADELTLGRSQVISSTDSVLLEASSIESRVGRVATSGTRLHIVVDSPRELNFPLIQFAQRERHRGGTGTSGEKYMRLRRILMAFRSHNKGALARFRRKIEHARVLQNDVGRTILDQLLADGIVILIDNFYFLQPDQVHAHLGVSYTHLREGYSSDKLEEYLDSLVRRAR